MTTKPKDFPFDEVAKSCERVIAMGGFVVQKWTCGGCARRISANNVNTLTHAGHCQHCNHITDLDESGCNFMMLIPSRPMSNAEAEEALGLTPHAVQ